MKKRKKKKVRSKIYLLIGILIVTTLGFGYAILYQSEDVTLFGEKYNAQKDKSFADGSGITGIPLDSVQIKNLRDLGLIWGFVKYYHPNIAKGDYNWDYELFKVLPKVINAKSQKERDNKIMTWINSLGPYPSSETEEYAPKNVKLKPDLDWIENSGFSAPLQNTLTKLIDAQKITKSYYIALDKRTYNPLFLHEDSYENMDYSDVGIKLLALYRYWSVIQYYYPYKYNLSDDWKKVLEKYIPKIIETGNREEYTLALLELIGTINDTHAQISDNEVLDNYFGLYDPALQLSYIENKVTVTGFYENLKEEDLKLHPGDVILKVNGTPVKELMDGQMKYTPASNLSAKRRIITNRLLRGNEKSVVVEYENEEGIHSDTLKTFQIKDIDFLSRYTPEVEELKFFGDTIAYINNSSLNTHHLKKIWNAIRPTKGLIIDIRNYPQDFPVYDLSGYLLPEIIEFVKITKADIDDAGYFTYGPTLTAGNDKPEYYKGKIIILVNEFTQSSAEFHAMAYRTHPNAVVIGSTTAGADGDVSDLILPGNIKTRITGIGIYYPDGKETQRIGIVPDKVVNPTIEGVREGRDELIEKALELINE